MAAKECSSITLFPEGPVPEEPHIASPEVSEDISKTLPPPAAGVQRETVAAEPFPDMPVFKVCKVNIAGQAPRPNSVDEAPQPDPTDTAVSAVRCSCTTGRLATRAPKPPVDEDRHFLISLLPAFHRMPRQQKLKTKIKFLQDINESEAEYRDIMRRILYVAQHPEQGRQPVGVEKQFVTEPDHTYYLVPDHPNKRARMMPESTGTVPQPNAKNGNLGGNAQNANLKEKAASGNLQENSASGNLQENVEIANLLVNSVGGNLQEVAEDTKSHKSIEIGNSQESAGDTKTQEITEINNLQGNVEVDPQEHVDIDNYLVDTVEINNAQEPAMDTNSEVNFEVGNVQVTVEAGISQENGDIINVQDTAEVGQLQENVTSGSVPMDIAIGNDEVKDG